MNVFFQNLVQFLRSLALLRPRTLVLKAQTVADCLFRTVGAEDRHGLGSKMSKNDIRRQRLVRGLEPDSKMAGAVCNTSKRRRQRRVAPSVVERCGQHFEPTGDRVAGGLSTKPTIHCTARRAFIVFVVLPPLDDRSRHFSVQRKGVAPQAAELVAEPMLLLYPKSAPTEGADRVPTAVYTRDTTK